MLTRTPRRVPIRRPFVAAALVALAASAGVASIGQTSEAAPQQATITVLPGIVQPGKKVANADKALSAVIATFSPAKKGRTVELQKKVGSKWVKVATGVQDRTGKVEFAAPSGSVTNPITYRAVAAKSSSLRTVASRAVATSQWGPATFTDQFPGTSLSSNWVHRMGFYQPESMRNCSKGSPAAVSVASGTLRLSVIRDPFMAPGSCTAYKKDGSVIGQLRLPPQRPHLHRRPPVPQVRRGRRPHQVPGAPGSARLAVDAAAEPDLHPERLRGRRRDRHHRVLRRRGEPTAA